MKYVTSVDRKTEKVNPSTEREIYTFEFSFQTKEQYLEFRDLWGIDYSKLSIELRNRKLDIRYQMHKQATIAFVNKPFIPKHYKELINDKGVVCYDVSELEHVKITLKQHAREYLAMLKAAKQEANRQYNMEHRNKQVA